MNALSPTNTTVIEPSRGWSSVPLRELWDFRELIYFFAWRDIKVRYKQSLLGISWALIQPIVATVLFTVVFGRWIGLESADIPFPLVVYAALLPWQLFANATARATQCLVTNGNLVRKVYFPRLIMPLSSVAASLADFFVAFAVFVVMLVLYGFRPGSQIFLLPLFLALVIATALGVGFWFAALNARYRDVGLATTFLLQVWLYASPVAYRTEDLVPEGARSLYALNPMVGVIEGFRWCLLDGAGSPGGALKSSTVISAVLLVSGLLYFRRVERTFADVV